MHVISVNTSPGREIEHQGKLVQTGIFKQPLDGPLAVGATGCAGDRQCDLVNHGGVDKAVYGFAGDHYDYWSGVLGRALTPGAFGENLTVAGLLESETHIGDRLRVGGAVLEVSQPRNPCFKLGIALSDERAPALFTQHFHTGVYFRVIEPGDIRAGDTIEVVQRHPAAVSVHALFRAHHDRRSEGRKDVLRAAADIPQLAAEWGEKVARDLQASRAG